MVAKLQEKKRRIKRKKKKNRNEKALYNKLALLSYQVKKKTKKRCILSYRTLSYLLWVLPVTYQNIKIKTIILHVEHYRN